MFIMVVAVARRFGGSGSLGREDPEYGWGASHLTRTVDAATLLLPGQSAECRVSLYAVPDTDDIVARSRQGDVAAFRHLFLQHRAEVSRLVFRMMGPRADLEDVVQEVFLQVHRSLKDFRGQSKFTTWLHRVTVNVVLMHRRAARSRPQMVAPLVEDIEVDPRLPPDEDLVRLERMRALSAA